MTVALIVLIVVVIAFGAVGYSTLIDISREQKKQTTLLETTSDEEAVNELVNVRVEVADLREQLRQVFDYPLRVTVVEGRR